MEKTREKLPEELKELHKRLIELERAGAEHKKILKQLHLLQKINNAVNTGIPLNKVLQIVADGVREVFGYAACDIHLLSKDKKELVYTTLSIDSNIVKKVEKVTGLTIIGYKIPLSRGSVFCEVVEKRKPCIVKNMVKYFEDFTDNKKLKMLAGKVAYITNFKAVIRVPLIAGDEVIGSLGVATRREVGDEDTEALTHFAAQVAIAIRKAQLEEALRMSEERYRNLVESLTDVVFTLSPDGRITYLNPIFEKATGYKRADWIGKHFEPIVHPYDLALAINMLNRALKGETPPRFELRIIKKSGEHLVGEFKITPHLHEGKLIGVFGVVRDITERKRNEEEMKRRLMKFKLEDGKLYLVKEPALSLSLEAFKDLLKVGYRGLVFSHTPEKEFKAAFPGNYSFFWLAEMAGDAMYPKLDEIERYLKKLPRKNAIFIDRLDYLIFKNGIERTLTFVQRMREIAYLGFHIVIISFDPATLSEAEIRLLEKETWSIELMHKEALPEQLFEVLAYIYRRNSYGAKPSYRDIGKGLSISKPTVQKRVRALISMGYIKETLKGNRKEVEILERGKALFLK